MIAAKREYAAWADAAWGHGAARKRVTRPTRQVREIGGKGARVCAPRWVRGRLIYLSAEGAGGGCTGRAGRAASEKMRGHVHSPPLDLGLPLSSRTRSPCSLRDARPLPLSLHLPVAEILTLTLVPRRKKKKKVRAGQERERVCVCVSCPQKRAHLSQRAHHLTLSVSLSLSPSLSLSLLRLGRPVGGGHGGQRVSGAQELET